MKNQFVYLLIVFVGFCGASNTPNTTQHTNATKTCSSNKDCKSCVKDNCFYCKSSLSCLEYKSDKVIPRGCERNNWFLKQCFLPGYVLIIGIPIAAALFLLICGCCIYCKCCRKKPLHWKKQEELITQRRKDRQQKADERQSERKKRTDAMRMKYGLLKDKEDDEDPLI